VRRREKTQNSITVDQQAEGKRPFFKGASEEGGKEKTRGHSVILGSRGGKIKLYFQNYGEGKKKKAANSTALR